MVVFFTITEESSGDTLLVEDAVHSRYKENYNFSRIIYESELEPEPPYENGFVCPPDKVLDWDICVDECPFGIINNNGVCQGFSHVVASSGIGTFGIILIFILIGFSVPIGFVIWRYRK